MCAEQQTPARVQDEPLRARATRGDPLCHSAAAAALSTSRTPKGSCNLALSLLDNGARHSPTSDLRVRPWVVAARRLQLATGGPRRGYKWTCARAADPVRKQH